jgi:hypothetical protein
VAECRIVLDDDRCETILVGTKSQELSQSDQGVVQGTQTSGTDFDLHKPKSVDLQTNISKIPTILEVICSWYVFEEGKILSLTQQSMELASTLEAVLPGE